MASAAPRVSAHHAPPRSRVAGLTGLRAFAVLAVLGYHLVPEAIPGGVVGVDVFFVISGFIVTRLLLVEQVQTGRIALRAFWTRRAWRLLPALIATLTVCIPLAFAVDPETLTGIRRQLVGALTFSSNWLSIGADGDYFRPDRPELFTNLWSLAVEEQFYLLCPLLLILAVVALRLRSRVIVIAALVLAVASAAAMALLSGSPIGSPTRAYFGTDTHAFGLLIGVALAVGLGATSLSRSSHRWTAVRIAVGVVSLAVLVALCLAMPSEGWVPAHGGLLLASIAAAGLIWAAATVPFIGSGLDVAPLRWLGERSYAVYLWHWPLFVILGATPLHAVPLALAAVTAALTLAAAALSFTFIERPFLQRRSSRQYEGGEGAARRTTWEQTATARQRRGPLVVGALVGVLAVGSVAIVVVHDDTSAAEALVARGRAAIQHDKDDGGTASSVPTPTPTPAAPTPTAAPVVGTDITAVGDSVMLAAAPELEAVLPGISIDAEVSRSMWAAPDILSRQAAQGTLRSVVVVGLATNGAVDPDLLGKVLDIIGPDRTLVLVNGHADRTWIPGANAALTAFAAAHSNVAVADWDTAITPHPEELAGDGIHPQPDGGTMYVGAVAQAIVAARAKAGAVVADEGHEAARNTPAPRGGAG